MRGRDGVVGRTMGWNWETEVGFQHCSPARDFNKPGIRRYSFHVIRFQPADPIFLKSVLALWWG